MFFCSGSQPHSHLVPSHTERKNNSHYFQFYSFIYFEKLPKSLFHPSMSLIKTCRSYHYTVVFFCHTFNGQSLKLLSDFKLVCGAKTLGTTVLMHDTKKTVAKKFNKIIETDSSTIEEGIFYPDGCFWLDCYTQRIVTISPKTHVILKIFIWLACGLT